MDSWAYGLLALGMGIYILSVFFGRLDRDRTHRSNTWARMVNSAALVLAALVWWRGTTLDTPLSTYAAFVFWGMLLSFIGDLLMAQFLPIPGYPIPGMLAFGTAHFLYTLAYVQGGQASGLTDGSAWAAAIAVWIIVGGILWRALIDNPGANPVLRYGSLVYALLIAVMAGSATALTIQSPRFIILALGAVLFVISDAILGNRILRKNDWFLVGDVTWATYITGQALIVFALPMLVG
jgi:hypothetical protein